MTMIEKIAKSIFLADFPNDNWERFKIGDVVNVRYIKLARAAIEAMRKPSDAMINIYYELNHKAGSRATFDVSTWERSIDAALKE